MKVGDTIRSGGFRWIVVGHFDASGSAYESEIWVDVKDLQQTIEAPHLLDGLRPAATPMRPPATSRP